MAVPAAAQDKVILHGVSLEQVAGIRAALAEGIALPEVLRQEGVAPDAWSLAERAWREAIAGSVEYQVELMQKTRVAEDCLKREVSPLEDDASSWVGVLGAVSLADDPSAVLEKLGITVADLGRLGRHWKRKAEADAHVAKQLGEVAPDAKPPERLTVAKAVLRPFPWTPEESKTVSAKPAPSIEPPAPLEPVIPAVSPLRQLASYQLRELEQGAAAVPAHPRPSYMLAESPPPAPPAPVAKPHAPVGSGTAAVDQSVVAAGLAIAAARTAKASAHPPPPSEVKPAPAPRVGSGTEAVDASVVEAGLALAAARAARTPDTPPIGAAPKPTVPTGTVFAPAPPSMASAVPFNAQPGVVPPIAARPAPERIATGTVLASPDAPASSTTPFQSADASRPLPPTPREMSLKQYAYVMACVKNASPAELPKVLETFGLSREQLTELQAHWKARLSLSIGLSSEYGALYADSLAALRAKAAAR